MHNNMAWRPYRNLMDGELDNRVPGMVTGWFRNGDQPLKVTLRLAGDFHEDIRGKLIRLRNPEPSDESDDVGTTYIEDLNRVQRGEAGDITAGRSLGPWTQEIAAKLMAQHEIRWKEWRNSQAQRDDERREYAERYRAHIIAGDPFYPYVDYPYIEWYSETNGRVVLELDPSQVEIVEEAPVKAKSPGDLVTDERRRVEAMGSFLETLANEFSGKKREQGEDGNVSRALKE